MTMLYLIVGLVALQRIGEVIFANHNTKCLKAEGAIEIGPKHYPLFFLLHGSWLLAILLCTSANAPVDYWMLALFLLLQAGRLWVIATLGKYWTTRIITLPSAPLIHKGPYRFLRHPNYTIVAAEIAVLPLAFGQWQIALIWSIANALLLTWRIRLENVALKRRA